ncbi:hypothetical protein MD484_g8217, partial [Candolleomyces efflorescens]
MNSSINRNGLGKAARAASDKSSKELSKKPLRRSSRISSKKSSKKPLPLKGDQENGVQSAPDSAMSTASDSLDNEKHTQEDSVKSAPDPAGSTEVKPASKTRCLLAPLEPQDLSLLDNEKYRLRPATWD